MRKVVRFGLATEPAHAPLPELPSVSVGTIVALDTVGRVLVRVGQSGPPLPARLAVSATDTDVRAAAESGQRVAIAYEDGDAARPIILGFLRSPGKAADVAANPISLIIETDVDGKRVRITGKDEVVLQCGSATITLRRNGRVIIHGTQVETCSEGTNRIKGGQVRIN